MNGSYDIIIIGGGAVGCAVAYTLAQYDTKIALLERNPDVAMGTSGKNSAVVHAGFNNRPGSLMARLCVKGNKAFENICRTLDVPYKKTGKLVTALNESDLLLLDEILEQGSINNCVGLSRLSKAEMNDIEPLVSGIAAMYSANTAVFNPFLYTIHLAESAKLNGVDVFLNSEVTEIKKDHGCFTVFTREAEFTADIIVNAAGLYSDAVAAMANDKRYKIYPSRGEYLILDKEACELVNMPVYPVPRKGVGGLGVHLTTTIDGNMLIGPSAEYVDTPESYETTQKTLDALWEEAAELLPQIERSMIIGAYTGIRAKTVQKGSANFGDFIIEESSVTENLINLIGIESPGLTASMPIAEYVSEIISGKHNLAKKSNYNPRYKRQPVFKDLNTEEQNQLIALDPDYGEIVCRCEQITRGEILRALNNPLGAKTLISVKNRTRATMGRCNGGYCFTRIIDSFLKTGFNPNEISYRYRDDTPIMGNVK